MYNDSSEQELKDRTMTTIQCTLKYTKFNQGEKLFTCRVQIPADTKQCDLFRVARELAHDQDEFAVYEQEVVEFKFKFPKNK